MCRVMVEKTEVKIPLVKPDIDGRIILRSGSGMREYGLDRAGSG